MVNNAMNVVMDFFEKLNKILGFSIECEIVEADKGKFPLYRRNGKLSVVPKFFNHPELREDVKTTLIAELYSCFFLDKNKDGHLDINPGFMAKGICDQLDTRFVPDGEIERNLRTVRRLLYDDIQNGCYFEIGHKLRESTFVSYEVTDIFRKTSTDTIITVKPIGCNLEKSDRTFTEEELYERCCNFRNLENEKVDMRRNLYVISGPSGVGKDTVVKALIRTRSDINKTISVTTRAPRSNEKEGVDYYFISREEFYDYQLSNKLVEYELYDGEYYGTLFSEIERHPTSMPLILVVDVRGRRNVMMRYPMAKSIFISPPSFESLKARILERNENTPDEVEYRLEVAEQEIEKASLYDVVVVNDNIDSCVKQISKIIFSICE